MTQSGIKPQPAYSAVWTNCATLCSTIHDNGGRIKNNAVTGNKVFV